MSTVSVIVCVKDQAPRLALVLEALAMQSAPPDEVVVVDDGSRDELPAVLTDARATFGSRLLVVTQTNRGAPAARNVGAERATSELLVFVDGDVLPAPTHVERHATFHAASPGTLGIGGLWHTTTTEYLRDPATGERFDVALPELTARALDARPESFRITRDDVALRFGSGIVGRARPGSYPHLGAVEREAAAALERRRAEHPAAWVTMSPQNFSVPRRTFLAAHGFDEALGFCEGWEFCLRLRDRGVPVLRVPDAPVYHLYHHRPFESFEEGLRRWRAVEAIARKRGDRAATLALLYYGSTGNDPWMPAAARITSLDLLAAALERWRGSSLGGLDTILAAHPRFSEWTAALEAEGGVSP